MIKLIVTFLLALFTPLLFAADGGLSLAPPPSDLSVIFLGNLFGVVDGVLHGSGSQIMGTIFGVFNSAVLALGGIIIMYTLLVSTMNTAHEGQMLGQKWSSIWIPLRSTMGLALLIPKASGYCLMQIFVMWVIVQGIGAADKVWEVALGYLNRGGVIIQAQSDPLEMLKAGNNGVYTGAQIILSGQVCMLGLQKQLEAKRQSYLEAKQKQAPPCYGSPSQAMENFCNTPIPDFLATVNTVIIQNNNKTAPNFSAPMPNFDSTSPLYFLNGICGTIKWTRISQLYPKSADNSKGMAGGGTETGTNATVGSVTGLSQSQLETAQMTRAIAIQQMYIALSSVAQVLVNNDPNLSGATTTNTTTNSNFSPNAKLQFGVPYKGDGTVCSAYGDVCELWGPLPTQQGTNSGVLFSGTEFPGAITDYNAIMTPTLNLLKQAGNKKNDNNARQFIQKSTNQGWIMAGSYYFDLVRLNGSATANANMSDSDNGLETSVFSSQDIISGFNTNGKGCVVGGKFSLLCTWFGEDKTDLTQVVNLVTGNAPTPDLRPSTTGIDTKVQDLKTITGSDSSTVYGFINNSMMVRIPGQPGVAPLQFANMIKFNISSDMYYLPALEFDCGGVKILFFTFCLGRMFGNLFYNAIFKNLYNFLLAAFFQIINQVIMAFLMVPLQGMAQIFKSGLQIVSQQGVNPIVALANMGTMYINFSANLWLMLLNIAVTSAIMMPFGVFIFALIGMALPLLLAWLGVMVSVGFVTAYYVPVLPYMIFTFGTIAWLIAVIEAMVAAPIVALGVTHPEGHDAFGKGEAAIMLLMNVFLRPSMMIIGYIFAIALSYVGVWILNTGFDHAISFIQAGQEDNRSLLEKIAQQLVLVQGNTQQTSGAYEDLTKYDDWAGVYAYFFSILTYTTMYLIIVQKSFTLISYLPDKVMRWIGGTPESLGQEAAGWGEELKSGLGKAAEETRGAQGQIGSKLGAIGDEQLDKIGMGTKSLTGGGGGSTARGSSSSSTGPNSTPSKPPTGGSGAGPGGGSKPPGGGAPPAE